MEFAEFLRILWSRKFVTIAIVVLAVAAAVAVRLTVSSVPSGAATVQILIDSPDSALANLSQETVPLTTRASVYAQVMSSTAVLEDVAAAAHVKASQLTAQGPYSGAGETLDVITPSEARSNQLFAELAKYRLTFVAQTNEPVVTASVQGPNAAAASHVAAAIYPGLQRYVVELQRQSGTPREHQVTIRQLGPPQAGPVNSSTRSTLMAAALLGVLLLGLLSLLGFEVLRRKPSEEESTLEPGYLDQLDQVAIFTTSSAQMGSETPAAAGSIRIVDAERH